MAQRFVQNIRNFVRRRRESLPPTASNVSVGPITSVSQVPHASSASSLSDDDEPLNLLERTVAEVNSRHAEWSKPVKLPVLPGQPPPSAPAQQIALQQQHAAQHQVVVPPPPQPQQHQQQSATDCKMTNCPVCLDVYKDPRVLTACGHSVCAECLQGVIDQGPSLISVKCPKCREWSRVPIHGFPKNYDLADAVATAASVSCSHTVEYVRAPTPTGLGCNACQKEFSQDDHIYECRTCSETLGEVEDGILLCADCALAGHKTHSVLAMEVASSEEIAEAEQLIEQFSAGMSFTHEPREVLDELSSLCRDAQKEVQALSEVRNDFKRQLRSKERLSKSRLSEVVDRAYSTFRAKQSVDEALTEAYKQCKSSLEKLTAACTSARRELLMPSSEAKPGGSSLPKMVTSAPLPKRTRV